MTDLWTQLDEMHASRPDVPLTKPKRKRRPPQTPNETDVRSRRPMDDAFIFRLVESPQSNHLDQNPAVVGSDQSCPPPPCLAR